MRRASSPARRPRPWRAPRGARPAPRTRWRSSSTSTTAPTRIDLGGTICLAIATAQEVASRHSRILGGRERVRLGAVELGLDCLRRHLQGLPVYERIDFEKA